MTAQLPEKPNQDQRPATKFISDFEYNKLEVFHQTKSGLYQPTNYSLVVTS
jgi:hypothetical protein